MFYKHKIAILLTATLFLSGCDSFYKFAGSDSMVNPVNWVSMLYEDHKKQGEPLLPSDFAGKLFDRPSPNPVSCTNSSVCGGYGKCVKKPNTNKGICMMAVGSDGYWIVRDKSVDHKQETKKVRSSIDSCTSDNMCPRTFQCNQTYLVCIKR